MANAKHSTQQPGDGVHVPYAWTFADETARAAGTFTDGLPIVAADIGKFARELDNNSIWMLIGFGPLVWSPIVAGELGEFGQDFAFAQNNSRSTTTSTLWQTKLTYTTPTLTGSYRIAWVAAVDQSLASDKVESRLRDVTNGVTLQNNDDVSRHEPKDVTNTIHVGSFLVRAFSAESITLEIQWRQQDGSTAGISNARIEIWKVSA